MVINITTDCCLNETAESDQWNQALKRKLLPVYATLLIYLLLGVLGNSFVLYIYLGKFKSYSEGRFFVPVLAVMDMLSCIVNSCGQASETLVAIIYLNDIACKIERYLRMVTTAFAMFTLVLIVIDRYLKICRPFGRQMTKPWKKILTIVVVSFGLFVSAPSFLFYGSSPKTSDNGTIIGRRCSSVNDGMPEVALAFNISLFSIASAELIFISVLYFLICRVIFQKAKFRNQVQTRKHIGELGNSANETSDCLEDENYVSTVSTSAITVKEKKDVDIYKESMKREYVKRESANSRITIVFLAIVIAFGISFIPTISMMIWESTRVDFWFTLTDQEYVGIMFLYTFYMSNNFINPFIYSFMDKKFKDEIRRICHVSK